jgi:cell wall-associated NlpC family hydrolase
VPARRVSLACLPLAVAAVLAGCGAAGHAPPGTNAVTAQANGGGALSPQAAARAFRRHAPPAAAGRAAKLDDAGSRHIPHYKLVVHHHAVPAASTGSRVSPGAPTDAQIRHELSRAEGFQKGASNRQLADQATITSNGLAVAPITAPAVVRDVINGGNQIAKAPYVYGGGHSTWVDSAYDCSGSVSFALATAGLIAAPEASGALEHWGKPGPGKWITVYANAEHAFMEIAGLRFDTIALAQSGTRWGPVYRSIHGFVARHPPGL